MTANVSSLDWRTQVNIFQAIKRAAQQIDAAEDGATAETVQNPNETGPVQGGADTANHPRNGNHQITLENIE